MKKVKYYKKEDENFKSSLLNAINKQQLALRNTSGHKKLVQYFEQMLKTDYFQSKMLQIRKKFKIPTNGFPPNPHFPVFPNNWIYRKDKDKLKELQQDIKDICKKFSLHYMDWKDPIEEKIFNDTYTLEYDGLNSHNLCLISDVVEEYPYGDDFKESDDMAYPIAIRISPYASTRDIIDFIKNADILIKSFQLKYLDKSVKIGKVKRKNLSIQKRNEFIYENRNLPRRKIMSLVNNKFGEILDYGHIGKIIQLEKKKRKDV